MNVKEYIASGIVESYVMGLLTEPERQAFEANCVQYPEIAAARNSFELALEARLLNDAVVAPVASRAQILDRIASATPENIREEFKEEQRPVRNISAWKWIAAASLILLAGAAYFAFDRHTRLQKLEARNQSLQEELQQVRSQVTAQPQQNDGPKSEFKMAAIREGAQVSASIYWDTISKDVYLMINNMPAPASDRQYQLWALLPDENAAPIDLGLIELRQERLLYRMKNVQQAKAFAITLEPKGGSKTPTSAPMVSTQPSAL